jgi:hypothetical protein
VCKHKSLCALQKLVAAMSLCCDRALRLRTRFCATTTTASAAAASTAAAAAAAIAATAAVFCVLCC